MKNQMDAPLSRKGEGRMAQTYGQVAKTVADRKAAHPELYCTVRGCLWHTAMLNPKRDGYILNANPCRKHSRREAQ